MKMEDIAFETTDWTTVPRVEHRGERGTAASRMREHGGIRVRMVEYSPDYLADHWCSKGHILLVLEGELITELANGRCSVLEAG